jgi:hypothetical protein
MGAPPPPMAALLALQMATAPPAPAPAQKPKPKKRKVMDEEDVLAIIDHELGQAVGQEGDELSKARGEALDYYEGKGFGNEISGRSTVVMRNVMEAVEWVLPAILRIFVASDKIAVIEPTRPGSAEAEAAAAATRYITQIFYKDNDGFSILHDWFKDALLQRLAWVKRWWETRMVQETDTWGPLSPQEYQAKLAELDGQPDLEYEVVEVKDYTDPMRGPVHDCTIMVTREESRVTIENVPPEEVLYSPKCRRGYMPFVCHVRPRTVSDLIAEGYDEDAIEEAVGRGGGHSDEAVRRQGPESGALEVDDAVDEAMREVWVEESYLLMDYNQDGIAELCKVTTVNKATRVLLRRDGEVDIAAVDESPLVPIVPIPMPHKLAGHSLADMVMDLQRIKSTILRQMLDNIYLTNNPRTIVADNAVNENTYDDIIKSRPGHVVRVRDVAGVVPLVTPFVAGAAFPIVEYLDITQEIRTGVSRHSQGLDPNVLNKSAASTASGINMLQQAAAARVELIARIFGRSVEELVRGILGLVRRHQQQARVVMVTGKPLTMDPRQWRSALDVNVDVGLGTGNRDQILAHLMQIIQLQAGIVQQQGGSAGPLVYSQNVYDALEKLTENAGFKESFFADPSQPPPQAQPPGPPKPDPEMARAQAQMQIDQQKAQAQAQIAAQKAQADAAIAQQKAAAELQQDRERAALELQLKEREMEARRRLEQQDADNRYALEQQKLANEMQIAQLRMQMEAAQAERAAQIRAAQPPPPGLGGGNA